MTITLQSSNMEPVLLVGPAKQASYFSRTLWQVPCYEGEFNQVWDTRIEGVLGNRVNLHG